MRFVLAVLLAAVCFGTTGTAGALGPENANATQIGAARILVGGGALAAVAGLTLLANRHRASGTTGASGAVTRALTASRPPTTGARAVGSSLLVVVIGACGVVAYQPMFFAGTSVNGVAIGTVVALGSAPVLTGVLDWAIHRRFPGTAWIAATAIATCGVAVLGGATGAAGPAAATTVPAPLGLLASVGAGASYAVYTLAGKELLDRGWSPTGSMGALFGLAAALSIPLLGTDAGWLATGPGLAMALWLGLVTTTLAYLLFGYGLAGLPASVVATLTLAEPLTASVLGLLVLHEHLSPGAVTGLVILACGILTLTLTLAARRPVRPAA
ncbi:DMT family transporter [Georgenia sp. SYP-B2076]|uniref:DMT family transporter n=1 Tax=Georgenia sp. SYP-B2076 TaxID=2495881 RepID=UPI000F8E3915|nr:EamA family transporter [Georgenia sp. SYP-B2076]